MSNLQIVEGGDKSGWYVLCQAGPEHYAIHSDWTSELIRTPDMKIVDIPRKRPGMLGLINHRGNVLPVVELRALIGLNSYRNEIGEMEEFLRAREADHISWLEELKRCVESGDRFTKALDPAKCAFGQWYDSLQPGSDERRDITGGTTVIEKIIDDFDAPHRRIHGIAERVLKLSGAGQIEEAKAIIQQTWDKDLSEMRLLFAKFFQAFKAMRQPSYVAVNGGDVQFALVVDSVSSVVSLEMDEFEPAPELTQSEHALVKECVHHDNRLIMVLDMTALISAVTPEMAS